MTCGGDPEERVNGVSALWESVGGNPPKQIALSTILCILDMS